MPLLFLTLKPPLSKTMSNSTTTFTITYQIPYPSFGLLEEWRTQTFSTKCEAERMIKFYKSCGSPAKFV